MRWTGFLTKEERMVFLTLSLCLLGGGLVQLANSVFELPDEIALPELKAVPIETSGSAGLEAAGGEGRAVGGGVGDATGGVGGADTYGRAGGAVLGGDGSPAATRRSAKVSRPSTKLDLNKATAAELEALPGVGPAIAGRIMEKRRAEGGFRSVEDLLGVRGIGEKTLAKFRQWVFVSSTK